MTRLPLDLYGEVTAPSGARFKWDANQPPGSRPRNLSFRTKIGDGFSDASLQLARRIDQDYPDLELVNDVVFTGADGSVAYEGRVAAMPREVSATHSIGVTLAGWMAHARDRQFTEVYVDRSLAAWGTPSVKRRATLLLLNLQPSDGAQGTDPTNNQSGVMTRITDAWASPYKPMCEVWYDAGPGNTISKIAYSWALQGNIVSGDANWSWLIALSPDDTAATGAVASANLRAAGPVTGATFTATPAGFRHAVLQLSYTATPAGSAGAVYEVLWTKLAAYGDHGLTLHTGEPGEPDGVYASDVLRDIAARWCPKLDISGIRNTDYVIQHLEFREDTDPYDAFLAINKYHLWHLGVWEGKRLDFRPYDLTDYDWEIRTDDPGTTFTPQGPSTENLFNGITVTYTDLLTGKAEKVTPDDESALLDTSTANPWNAWGIPRWDKITLSAPALRTDAVELGRAALGDRNRPKTPGTITSSGYIRDRAGVYQPCWKVRAGDTIAITNFPNDEPRLIVETDYNDEDKTIKLAIDKPFALLDAYLDRQANALQARNLR